MKRFMMCLFLPLLFAGCTGTGEIRKEDLKTDDRMPVKVIYGRRWIYGANYESEDPELIRQIVSALGYIETDSESNMMVTDFTDLVFLYYEDGTSKTYEFEDQCIVKDGKRYHVTGIEELRIILYSMAEKG